MDNVWLVSSAWIGLALVASLISIRVGISVALVEILVGVFAGNLFGLKGAQWVSYLAGAGSIILTFLAGAEIDGEVVRKHFWPSTSIGVMGFCGPFFGVLLYARYVLGWNWQEAEIAGLALSTTSVAVVYAVMIETGFNETEIGKPILAACFINDLATVLVLGISFANYNWWLALFVVVMSLGIWLLPRFVPAFFRLTGSRISEPETKFILLTLFFFGGLANLAKSEAVLPAYLIGMVLAPYFLRERIFAQRLRVIAFTLLTPFFFIRAGALVKFGAVVSGVGMIGIFLLLKIATKFIGVWPLARGFKMKSKEAVYTTLLMSTGLTFGSICALFGLNNGIINDNQYATLVTAVIGSAIIPTLVAQRWFQPDLAGRVEGEENV